MIGLTRKQADLLAFIKAYMAEHGACPSYQEMALAVGLKAKSGAHTLVSRLEERGYIRRPLCERARAIEIVDHNPLAGVSTGDLLAEIERRHPASTALALVA